MALQDILKKVLEEASQLVSTIEEETKTEIADIQKQIKVTEKEELSALAEQHLESLDSIKAESISSARREQNKFQLSAKCAVLELALDVFYKHLLALSDTEYEKLIKNLFASISDEGEVFASTKRLAVTKKVAPKNVSVTADDSIEGGFVFKTKVMSVDNSFKNVVYSEYKTEIEAFFAKELGLI